MGQRLIGIGNGFVWERKKEKGRVGFWVWIGNEVRKVEKNWHLDLGQAFGADKKMRYVTKGLVASNHRQLQLAN